MRVTTLLLACSAWWATTVPLGAQPATPGPSTRLDVHGSLGWAHAARPDLSSYDNWDHDITHGALGVGWYWTDHLKTEVELNAHTPAEFHRVETISMASQATYRASRFKVATAGIGILQVYQFLRNTWVHPYVGAGVDLRREVIDEDVEPVVGYDNASRQFLQLEPGRRVGPRVALAPSPFVAAGAKTYVSTRAFVRSDLRVSVGRGAHDVVARVGIGVDF